MNSLNQLKKLCSLALVLFLGGATLHAIQLHQTLSPSRGLVGSKLTYTYSLQNDGVADESGTLFTNALPPNSVFVSALVTNGAYTVSNNIFSFRPERLLAGSTTTIQLAVTPVNTYDLTNSARWVSSSGIEAHILSVAPVDSARPGPQLIYGRSYHTSTLLADGRVLVAGGQTRISGGIPFTKAAEVYIPANNSFSLVGEMSSPRASHTATRLPNGMVLFAGGTVQSDGTQASPETAETFDPVSNTFSVIATSMVNRSLHTATLLPNGDMLLAGGAGTNTAIERLHFQDGKWTVSAAGSLLQARAQHVACLLANGKVLFAGGTSVGSAFAEIFDPELGASQMIQTPATQLPVVATSRGKVLLQGYLPGWVPGAEVYDPELNTFTQVVLPPGGSFYRLSHYVPLASGEILQTGGYFTSAVNIFDLRACTITAAPTLSARRGIHTAVQFANGSIFLMGGYINNDGSGDMRSTEFYGFRPDSDLDGMDDEWELANALDPSRREDAIEDADGDGHTNLQEFLTGTDPHDASNVLKIEPPQISDQKMRVRFPTVIGKYYQVEKSDQADLHSWLVVATNLRGDGQLMQVDDPIDVGTVRWLYRVVLLP